jgi:hypothetical protein
MTSKRKTKRTYTRRTPYWHYVMDAEAMLEWYRTRRVP